jgi:hypothetical protein
MNDDAGFYIFRVYDVSAILWLQDVVGTCSAMAHDICFVFLLF